MNHHPTFKMSPLGAFDNASGEMLVTDPSEQQDSDENLMIEVLKGRWLCFSTSAEDAVFGRRVCSLEAMHVDEAAKAISSHKSFEWESTQFYAAVTKGMLGFFDYQNYGPEFRASDEDVKLADFNFDEEKLADSLFYAVCAGIVTKYPKAGVFSTGVVAESGYGDGGYLIQVSKGPNGCHKGIRVQFIYPEELDDAEGEVFIKKE